MKLRSSLPVPVGQPGCPQGYLQDKKFSIYCAIYYKLPSKKSRDNSCCWWLRSFKFCGGQRWFSCMAEFHQAHKDFLAQLSDEEKRQFAPIKDGKTFLSEVFRLSQATKAREWTKLFRTISRCSENLATYFDVAGILVQSHPEFAAIAWGSFRLVLSVRGIYMLVSLAILVDCSLLAITYPFSISSTISSIVSARRYQHTTH